MKTFLFQGDSITDAGRDRNRPEHLGSGYPKFCAGKIGLDHLNEFKFYNRGISGNRSIDMYARIKKDAIQLSRDYMSVLIGVNDVWHELSRGDGLSTEKTELFYDMFLSEVKEALPNITIFLLEPFFLPSELIELDHDAFIKGVAANGEVTKRLAEKHGCIFIPLQQKISEAAEKSSIETILKDGVHPTEVGHELIARELTAAIEKVL